MFKWLKKNYQLFVIIGACILVFRFLDDKESYVSEYNAKITALEQKVDSLHHINDELTFKIDTLNVQISKLDQQLASPHVNTQNMPSQVDIHLQLTLHNHFELIELSHHKAQPVRQINPSRFHL